MAGSFRDQLLAATPALRAFAISLVRNGEVADDLVQETLMRAWAHQDKFEPGSNLTAWLFTILRNFAYSMYRGRKPEVEDPDGTFAAELTAPAAQHGHMEFLDLQVALRKLSMVQREAILLVAAEGLSYEETAAVAGVKVGTIKSRVNRGRAILVELMDGVENASISSHKYGGQD